MLVHPGTLESRVVRNPDGNIAVASRYSPTAKEQPVRLELSVISSDRVRPVRVLISDREDESDRIQILNDTLRRSEQGGLQSTLDDVFIALQESLPLRPSATCIWEIYRNVIVGRLQSHDIAPSQVSEVQQRVAQEAGSQMLRLHAAGLQLRQRVRRLAVTTGTFAVLGAGSVSGTYFMTRGSLAVEDHGGSAGIGPIAFGATSVCTLSASIIAMYSAVRACRQIRDLRLKTEKLEHIGSTMREPSSPV